MSELKRIIPHWGGDWGDYKHEAGKPYHFYFDKNGVEHEGWFPPEANTGKLRKGKYAAHVRRKNTGSIGLCCGGMADAKWPDDVGTAPVTRQSWDAMCRKSAVLCLKYDIPVTPFTVLTHAEVEPNLGVKQNGKWDFTIIPFEPSIRGAKACGDYYRKQVSMELKKLRFMAGASNVGEPDYETALLDVNTHIAAEGRVSTTQVASAGTFLSSIFSAGIFSTISDKLHPVVFNGLIILLVFAALGAAYVWWDRRKHKTMAREAIAKARSHNIGIL